MNSLSKETNVRGSLKKFFVDNLGIAVTFDTSLASPDLRAQGIDSVNQWYNIDFGEFGRNELAEFYFDIYILSRQDPEGVLLIQNTDTVMGLLLDSTKTDGMKRIPLYDVSVLPWVFLTNMVIQDIWDSPSAEVIEDETKIKLLSVKMRWGAKI